MKTTSFPKPLTAFHLKLIALATMIVDHIGVVLVPVPFLRNIGRVAFPLYAFLIAEGCRHTRSRERYLLRLGLLALVSEIPFDLAFHSWAADILSLAKIFHWAVDFLNLTNVFYTLFLAVFCIHIYETLRRRGANIKLMSLIPAVLFLIFLVGMSFSVLSTEYRLEAILLVVVCVVGILFGPLAFIGLVLLSLWLCVSLLTSADFLPLCLAYLAVMLVLCFLVSQRVPETQENPGYLDSALALLPALPILLLADALACDYSAFGVLLIVLLYLAKTRPKQIAVLALGMFFEYRWSILHLCFALASAVLVCFYNGERGRDIKWPFYWAYPAHLALLAAIKLL